MMERCGIPSTAISLSLNVTVTAPSGSGYLTVFASDKERPITSSINYSAGQTRANSAVLRLSDGPNNRGNLALYVGPASSGTVHAIIDVTGYFE
jgi:hypothetical protein